MIEAMFVFLDDTDDFEFEALHLHAEDFMTTVDFLNLSPMGSWWTYWYSWYSESGFVGSEAAPFISPDGHTNFVFS